MLGKWTVSPAISVRTGWGMAGTPSHWRGLGTAPTDPPPGTTGPRQGPTTRPDQNEPRTGTLQQLLQLLATTDHRLGTLHAFCRVGLRPFSAPRPAPFLAPPSFETPPEGPRRGGVPPPRPRHTAHPPIGRGRATPLPLFTQFDEGRKIRAGVI